MTVSSGLAFIPMALTPTYCATKAAIHSWSQSLRYQLKSTNIEVLELAPPYVQTELMGSPAGLRPPRHAPRKTSSPRPSTSSRPNPTPKRSSSNASNPYASPSKTAQKNTTPSSNTSTTPYPAPTLQNIILNCALSFQIGAHHPKPRPFSPIIAFQLDIID